MTSYDEICLYFIIPTRMSISSDEKNHLSETSGFKTLSEMNIFPLSRTKTETNQNPTNKLIDYNGYPRTS